MVTVDMVRQMAERDTVVQTFRGAHREVCPARPGVAHVSQRAGLVLVTPKATLPPGGLVEARGALWEILAPHELDEFKTSMRSEGRWTCEQHGAHGPGAAGAVQPLWEELLQAVPDARRQAVEEAGAAVQRELNAQIGAAELADGAKGTVRTWQELRVGSKGGYAALSPEKGRPSPGWRKRSIPGRESPCPKAGHPLAGAGHGTRRPAAGSSRSWNQAGGPESRGPQPPDMSRAGNSIAGQRRRRWSPR